MTSLQCDKEVAVFQWTIRNKLLLGVGTLIFSVCILAFSGFRGVYSYRELARSIKVRASELPLAADLTQKISHLRVCLSRVRDSRGVSGFTTHDDNTAIDRQILRDNFHFSLLAVNESLRAYRSQLENGEASDPLIGDSTRELAAVAKIQQSLKRVRDINGRADWMLDDIKVEALDEELEHMHRESQLLPTYLQERMHNFAGEVRGQYRAWIALTWITFIIAVLMLGLMLVFLWKSVFKPIQALIEESRKIPRSDFKHRIPIQNEDEVSELATAMNQLTDRFQTIRDDLDNQVTQRTKEVVRSEQLASVGFLAAGVSHEINNPLASIAMCAESLESRLHDILQTDDELPDEEHNQEVDVLRTYLKCIQDEAFRCKRITESLLDYSRMNEVERKATDLAEVTQSVIEMLQNMGKCQEETITFQHDRSVIVWANAQELKQVLVNLLTNGLDAVDPGGEVRLVLTTDDSMAKLVIADNGCGMTDEVMQHLFEPFYTRRRSGQGTGLGLSITERIIADHEGKIVAHSDGPGHGSQFNITLPLVNHEQKKGSQAA